MRFVFAVICFVEGLCFICFVCFYLQIGVQRRFRYQMMFVSFNNNMTGATSGAGTAYTFRAAEFTAWFYGVNVAQSLVLRVFCGTLFVLLSLSHWPSYCLSYCPFPIGHRIVCPSIYAFSPPLWYLQTFLIKIN